ncbi:putative methyltransferase DDB_G0268948 [Protopterus annectens]|uniref:putative methyltransferase DDB_G0268948 n=1 Tax=Protopterus annectens TaxID=7888 RepID=UPI001CFBBD60|nr:putative methyltransferase DDB_G0268948 [Protopterus annectens]XP_043931630.1 putative methyltransferase DDB_G0268948 [Protopterus annectens]
MSHRFFEGEEIAMTYSKYRHSPPEEVQSIILSYIKEKRTPVQLAVDVGCGTGLSTRALAAHFRQVVGTDISEAQIEEAKKVPGFPNISYCICPAEKLPFKDSSVDLVFSSVAAHWFNIEGFMSEVKRVLKPNGCLSLHAYQIQFELHYKDLSETLSQIYQEAFDFSCQYLPEDAHESLNIIRNEYKEIFDSIPFTDKTRITNILVKQSMSVANVVGLISTVSAYQYVKEKDPDTALSLIQRTEQRLLEAMGVSSNQTKVELRSRYFCLLACKSE